MENKEFKLDRKKGRPKKVQPIIIEGDYACIYGKDKRHVIKRFKVIRDGVLSFRLIPFGELNNRREELIRELSRKIGKKLDGEILMKDILEDTSIEKLEKLNKSIERGAEIRPREGCFYMEIKDKKRKKPLLLSVRK